MPAFLTHRAAGERVLSKLNSEAMINKGAFYLGCQGPDIMFFRNYYPWKSSKDNVVLGIAMHHEHIRELFEKGLGFVKSYAKKGRDELVSYMAGFITHYAIDKNAHPFVYGKAGDNTNMHHAIEFMWDSYSAQEQWGIEPDGFDVYRDVMAQPLGEGVCRWYQAMAKDIYGMTIGRRMARQAQRDFAKAKRALMDLHWPGRVLLSVISRLSGFDVGTMLYPKQRDHSLFTAEEYEHMRQMIERGVDEAAKMIAVALEYIGSKKSKALPAWFGDLDFSGTAAKP